MSTEENAVDDDFIATSEFFVRTLQLNEERAAQDDFKDAKQVEVDGLIKRKIWTVCKEPRASPNSIFIGEELILTLNNYGTLEEKAKVQIVSQGFDDRDNLFIIYFTSVLRSLSIRVILSSASHHIFVFSHDSAQAYLQIKQRLIRNIYIKVIPSDREEVGIKDDELLQLTRLLYKLCDSGDY